MFQAICFKEFYKIRWLWCVLFVVNIGMAANLWITVRRLFVLDHSEIVWYRVIHLGQIYFEPLRFLPVICGILIACFQFLPEMSGERLKLSLHLPIPGHRLMSFHIVSGMIALLLALLPSIAGLWVVTSSYFPHEVLVTVFFTTAPWFLAGIAGYLGGALVFLEPSMRYRFCNALLTIALVGIYVFRAKAGAYAHDLGLLFFPLILMMLSVFYPALRFRYRREE